MPARVWAGGVLLDRDADPDAWEAAVARDIPLVTRWGSDGLPVSSSSMPYMVATMLRHLDLDAGGRVLEVGTGTGWTAALLAYRLGADRVTSIEVDPSTAADAEHALGKAGFTPTLLVGDGADGHPDAAPYTALLATCTVEHLPYAWVAQTRGVIVTPWGNGMTPGTLLRLESDGRRAVGRVVDTAAFMWLEAQRPRAWATGEHGDDATTALDPRLVFADVHELFAVGLRVPGCRFAVGWGSGDEADECTLWLSDGTSWASADSLPGRDRYPITQAGPRRLWDEVESAYRWWTAYGRPEVTRFGLTVDRGGRRFWLDEPD
ncbi:methyltransferase domain-containing protein [Yinghuangia soli]|uniref:Protein-L-isoaspartate O-methyltransferase n=1 Tax=Yinghuangia soli TaxID=2908204 RepID=A0AA41PW34_9ACTN|nr:methyltransferase domain-containing protein [Yinghuangia soli]MCF2526954.1 methyltransferase domain-containing protein [Yinghuangia soli]